MINNRINIMITGLGILMFTLLGTMVSEIYTISEIVSRHNILMLFIGVVSALTMIKVLTGLVCIDFASNARIQIEILIYYIFFVVVIMCFTPQDSYPFMINGIGVLHALMLLLIMYLESRENEQ